MSYTVDVVNVSWKKLKNRQLSEKVFNDENVQKSLIHDFVVLQLSNARNNIAHVKTRWEVKASWRKLFRQKGTGRARAGDAASPIRRGWWQSFGPRKNTNFVKKMNKKARKKALAGALTIKAKEWHIICLNKFPYDDIKTKNAFSVLKNNNLEKEKLLLVVWRWDDIISMSFRNIPNVKYILSDYLNPYDLLTHTKVLFLSSSLDDLENSFE